VKFFKHRGEVVALALVPVAIWMIIQFQSEPTDPELLKQSLQMKLDQRNQITTAVLGPPESQGQTGERTTIGGPFSLINQHGIAVSHRDFYGDFMLVNFGYTGCPDICPVQLEVMSEAVDALGADGARVRPVFITIDPERDTVERMAAFAQSFHPRLVALTGGPRQIERASQAYRVFHAKAEDHDASGHYLVDHTSYIYLMGPNGKYLAHFEAGTSPEAIAEEIRGHM
jgi:protein SCO1/2